MGFGSKKQSKTMLEQSRGCNYVQERNQRKSKTGVMYCNVLRQASRRPLSKQRGIFELTSLGKRHLSRFGSRLVSFICESHV